MMRPNKIGWFIVALFLLGGIGFWIAMPEIFIGQIWVAVSLVLAAYYANLNRRAGRADELMRTGVRGEAQILEMTQTGVYVNQQPRVKLKLRVQAPGVSPFEDERTETVPLIVLGRLSSGMPLPIFLKPEDPRAYVIDWSGGGQPSAAGGMAVQSSGGSPINVGANPEAQRAVMDALRQHGIDTSSGAVDLRGSPDARAAVLAALRDHGIDAAHQAATQDPSVPIEDKGEPMQRLTKLQELRSANLISAEEFEAYKKRILEDV